MKIICTQQLNNTPAGCDDLHKKKSKLGNREWTRNKETMEELGWFRYSGMEGIRRKGMPWGTVWSWRFPLCRGGCEGKRVVGKDGPSVLNFQALRHNTGVVLPHFPILGISLWAWVGELRGHAPLPLVYIQVSLACKGEGSMPWADDSGEAGRKVGEGGGFSSSCAHMDTSVFWHEGYPITLGCYSHLKSCLDWKGCHRSQSCSWSPLYCRSRHYPKAIISGTIQPWVKSSYFSLIKQSCDRCIHIPLHLLVW